MKTTITSYFLLFFIWASSPVYSQKLEIDLNKNLKNTTEKLIASFDEINAERKKELEELGNFMVEQLADKEKFSALFVCTHNSRRSHIADLWFKYGMLYYGLHQFDSFSGGTEATAFNPKAIEAIKRAGFTVIYDKKIENPVVSISPRQYPEWRMKSKVYTDKINPKEDFVAVMVCSEADKSCPAVDGATGRFAIPYNDPRHFDDTPSEMQKYDETVALIGSEMLYLSHHIKNQIIIKEESGK